MNVEITEENVLLGTAGTLQIIKIILVVQGSYLFMLTMQQIELKKMRRGTSTGPKIV